MGSLFHHDRQPSPRSWLTAVVSVTAHALILTCIIAGTMRLRHTVILRPATAGSAPQVSMIEMSHSALSSALEPRASVAKKNPAPHVPAIRPHTQTPEKPAITQPQQAQASLDESSSGGKPNPGVTGSGSSAQSMYPAYPTVSPSPPVKDRALLPQADRRVVVDVNLGADGKVEQATLVAGLGNALDQIVLDTVRGWQFHPAMLNGGPVPSNIELVFPFNRNYPLSE